MLNCRTYYDRLADYILQEDARFLKLGQLTEAVFGDRDALFVRPDDNEKSFVGQVVKRDLCKAFVQGESIHEWCPPDLDIVVASPRKIAAEWRLVIVEDLVAAGSQYKENGCIDIQAGFPLGVGLFAEEVIRRWRPHPVFVLDIGEVGGEYKVVEVGPFNYAGLYKCDLELVVDAISQYTDRTYG